MREGPSTGQIVLWEGGSIWIGRAGAVNDVHAHHAVQVALALEGRLRFRSPADAGWLDCAGAVIASNRPHAFDGRQAPLLAHVFVEPQSLPGRALLERFPATHGICLLEEPVLAAVVPDLVARYRAGRDAASLVAAAQAVLRTLTDGAEASLPTDPRVLGALAYLNEHLDGVVSLERVAATVHLSPGRFRHLFVSEMGLPLRQYVLWLRLKRAVEAFASGSSLTSSAYAAGFADSAHLSRTFRRMYGMAAASLRLE